MLISDVVEILCWNAVEEILWRKCNDGDIVVSFGKHYDKHCGQICDERSGDSYCENCDVWTVDSTTIDLYCIVYAYMCINIGMGV